MKTRTAVTKKLTRKQKIEAIKATVDGWDLDTLIGFTKDYLETTLKTLSSRELDQEYRNQCDPNA